MIRVPFRGPRRPGAVPICASVVCCLLLFPTICSAQGWVLSGRVVNPQGTGIAGIDLDVTSVLTGAPVALVNDDSDAGGFFSVTIAESIPSGNYELRFDGVGWVSQTPIISIAGNTDFGTITLQPGWVLTGLVTDGSGVGIPGMDVDVFFEGTVDPVLLAGDDTAADGSFQATIQDPIPVGLYDIAIDPPAGSPWFPTLLEGIFLGGSTTLPTIVLDAGVLLSGSVVDAGGLGLFEVEVDVLDTFDDSVATTATDTGGSYTVLLEPGTWAIEFRATLATGPAPRVPVRLEDVPVLADTTLADVVLHLGYATTGTVQTSAGLPVVGGDIDVIDPTSGAQLLTDDDNTDVLGAFSVLVPAGDWLFEVAPPATGALLVPQLVPFTVAPPPATNDLGLVVLPTGVLVTGTTVDPLAAPVPDVDLDFIISSTQIEIPTANDNANTQGQFSVAVVEDTYDIAFRPPYTTGLAPLLLDDVTVAGNTGLGAVTLPSGFALTGTVTASGAPVEGAELSVTESVGGGPVYTFGDDTDAAGQYAIRLVGGTYDVTFTPPAGSGLDSVTEAGVVVAGDLVLDADLTPVVATPPVASLVCSVNGADVTLSWTNGAPDYDEISVRRDGVEIALLPGSATEALDAALPDGFYSYAVVARRGGVESAAATCTATVVTGPPGDFLRGDANLDQMVNLGDAITILEGLFSAGPLPCLDAADANDDGSVDISDAIFALAYLFSGGPEPAPPFPAPGPDPTPDTLICP